MPKPTRCFRGPIAHRGSWRSDGPTWTRLIADAPIDGHLIQGIGQFTQSAVRTSAMSQPRSTWTDLSDEQLLAQCEVDTYRASGPGGQKRNKTSSAVRLRHPPTGIIVIAEESRSQHENRARALRRLRRAIYLQIRQAPEPQSEFWQTLCRSGRVSVASKDERFWPIVGIALDALYSEEGRVRNAAELLGITTGNLIRLLRSDPRAWQRANELRTQFGHKPFKT